MRRSSPLRRWPAPRYPWCIAPSTNPAGGSWRALSCRRSSGRGHRSRAPPARSRRSEPRCDRHDSIARRNSTCRRGWATAAPFRPSLACGREKAVTSRPAASISWRIISTATAPSVGTGPTLHPVSFSYDAENAGRPPGGDLRVGHRVSDEAASGSAARRGPCALSRSRPATSTLGSPSASPSAASEEPFGLSSMVSTTRTDAGASP